MEDDDEFGDLYTDVLQPFPSSLSSAPQAEKPSPAPPSLHRPSDLSKDDDDDEILYGASHRNSDAPSNQSLPNSALNSIPTDNNSAGGARVLGSPDAKLPKKPSSIGDLADFQSDKQDKEVNFDIEEGNTGIIEDSDPMIPGLMVNGEDSRRNEVDVSGRGSGGGGEGDEDWEEDSDSEDDLQIVLNDANHGPMGMERGVMGDGEDDDDDEDGDPLVIVADGDPNQAMEEQDWGVGEDAAAAVAVGTEGERKEGGEAPGKGNAVAGPKIGYSNHGYHHPFHSQFKVSVVAVI